MPPASNKTVFQEMLAEVDANIERVALEQERLVGKMEGLQLMRRKIIHRMNEATD